MYRVSIFLYLCFSLFVFAESISTVSESRNVQSLVKQVKLAKPADKRVLMNRLKIMLRHTNQVHRMTVMKDLKQSFSHTNGMHKRQQRRKRKLNQSRFGKHQPKHKRDGKGCRSKGRGKRGGRIQH